MALWQSIAKRRIKKEKLKSRARVDGGEGREDVSDITRARWENILCVLLTSYSEPTQRKAMP